MAAKWFNSLDTNSNTVLIYIYTVPSTLLDSPRASKAVKSPSRDSSINWLTPGWIDFLTGFPNASLENNCNYIIGTPNKSYANPKFKHLYPRKKLVINMKKEKFQNLNFRVGFSIWFHFQKMCEITILNQKWKSWGSRSYLLRLRPNLL